MITASCAIRHSKCLNIFAVLCTCWVLIEAMYVVFWKWYSRNMNDCGSPELVGLTILFIYMYVGCHRLQYMISCKSTILRKKTFVLYYVHSAIAIYIYSLVFYFNSLEKHLPLTVNMMYIYICTRIIISAILFLSDMSCVVRWVVLGQLANIGHQT